MRQRHPVPDLPGNPEGGHRLFQADEIVVEHEMAALLSGKVNIQSVNLVRPTIYTTEDVDHGAFTFQYLKESKPTFFHLWELKEMERKLIPAHAQLFNNSRDCLGRVARLMNLAAKQSQANQLFQFI